MDLATALLPRLTFKAHSAGVSHSFDARMQNVPERARVIAQLYLRRALVSTLKRILSATGKCPCAFFGTNTARRASPEAYAI